MHKHHANFEALLMAHIRPTLHGVGDSNLQGLTCNVHSLLILHLDPALPATQHLEPDASTKLALVA